MHLVLARGSLLEGLDHVSVRGLLLLLLLPPLPLRCTVVTEEAHLLRIGTRDEGTRSSRPVNRHEAVVSRDCCDCSGQERVESGFAVGGRGARVEGPENQGVGTAHDPWQDMKRLCGRTRDKGPWTALQTPTPHLIGVCPSAAEQAYSSVKQRTLSPRVDKNATHITYTSTPVHVYSTWCPCRLPRTSRTHCMNTQLTGRCQHLRPLLHPPGSSWESQ